MALTRTKLAKYLKRARVVTGGRFPYKAVQKLKKSGKYPKMSGRSKPTYDLPSKGEYRNRYSSRS